MLCSADAGLSAEATFDGVTQDLLSPTNANPTLPFELYEHYTEMVSREYFFIETA